MTAQTASRLFAALAAVAAAFQLALALGAPWGELAMGGAYRGALPPALRYAALAQMALLTALALVMLCRAGLILRTWRAVCRPLAWVAVALLSISALLNLATPSAMERLVWAPIVIMMVLAGLRVASSR